MSAEIQDNPYRPNLLRIEEIHDETDNVRTLTLDFVDEGEAGSFPGWRPGQFGQFTVFGVGESVFALANAPWQRACEDDRPFIQCTFRAVGKVTYGLRRLGDGQLVGFRGPYGNHFPVDEWRGKDLVFIGGGIGMAALRSPLLEVLGRRPEFGEIVILNGARTVSDLVYRDEMPSWDGVDGVRVVRTVDPEGESDGWDGEIGLLPNVFEGLDLAPDGRVVVACGPPVMLHYLFLSLRRTGYGPDQVFTTLENKMKCGIGHCGRCSIGSFYVCRDGPVVSWREMERLPKDY
jgi:NAD(P)H-flavin reductase